jgi:hypothetical protein
MCDCIFHYEELTVWVDPGDKVERPQPREGSLHCVSRVAVLVLSDWCRGSYCAKVLSYAPDLTRHPVCAAVVNLMNVVWGGLLLNDIALGGRRSVIFL